MCILCDPRYVYTYSYMVRKVVLHQVSFLDINKPALSFSPLNNIGTLFTFMSFKSRPLYSFLSPKTSFYLFICNKCKHNYIYCIPLAGKCNFSPSFNLFKSNKTVRTGIMSFWTAPRKEIYKYKASAHFTVQSQN